MRTDAGRGTVDEGRRRRGTIERLTPAAKPVQAGPESVQNPSPEPVDRSPRIRSSIPWGPTAKIEEARRGGPALPAWLGRLGYYGLALFLVGVAALLYRALRDVPSPTPFLVFYLAWVGAAAFGGLGPGLLATLASWLCVDLFFDPTPWHVSFHDPGSVGRLMVLLAGGLAVSVVGETMRRSRIRERRQGRELAAANAALRASEEKYRFLVENSTDVTGTIDLQGKWTFVSANVERVTGYRADEFRGVTVWDFLAPECHDLAKENLRRCLRGENVPPYELLAVGKDGRHIPFEVHTVSIIDDGGNIVGVQGVSRDITERQRAEAALRESEQRYRGIVEDQTELICLFEGDETITFVNDAYCRYFGKKREELVGHKFLPLIAEADQEAVKAQIAALSRENPFVTLEERVRRPDGSIAWQEWKNRAVFDVQGHLTGYQAVGRDITERQRAEEALRELNATLESKVAERTEELERRARQLQKLTLELTETEERERKRIAEILHDDLQQVLAAAKFQVSLLSDRVKNDIESQEIAGQTRSLLADAIVKSRSLSHELSTPALYQSDLCEAVEWLVEQMRTKHGLTVHLETSDRIELASEPLRVLLYKAAQELLFNVIKHGGVHEATLRLRHRRGHIRLSVSDEGQGFDPTEPGSALGFGLLSIRERLGLLGGRLKIRSAPGKGSTFVITVPDSESSQR